MKKVEYISKTKYDDCDIHPKLKIAIRKARWVRPTRELALQIKEEFKILAKGTTFSSICLIGDRNINTDIQRLKRDYDLVVAPPRPP